MRVRTGSALAVAAVFVIGCEPTPASELLELDFGDQQVFVDTVCSDGGCESIPMVSGTLSYEDDGTQLDADAFVGVHQYRVDYDDVLGLTIPFLADTTDEVDDQDTEDIADDEGVPLVTVPLSGTATLAVQAAGTRQRNFVSGNFGDSVVVVAARVTLQGYDQRNTPVTVETGDFTVVFTNGSD